MSEYTTLSNPRVKVYVSLDTYLSRFRRFFSVVSTLTPEFDVVSYFVLKFNLKGMIFQLKPSEKYLLSTVVGDSRISDLYCKVVKYIREQDDRINQMCGYRGSDGGWGTRSS